MNGQNAHFACANDEGGFTFQLAANFYFLNSESGKEQPLIRDETVGWAFEPRYSEDGRNIVLFWNRDQFGIWMLSKEDHAGRLIKEGELFPIRWSKDGRTLYVSDGRGTKLARVSVANGKNCECTRNFPSSRSNIRHFSGRKDFPQECDPKAV